MGEDAIEQYEWMVLTVGEDQVPDFMTWMGEMIRFCEAQDARLE